MEIVGTTIYPINFMAVTCKEYTFSFLPVDPSNSTISMVGQSSHYKLRAHTQ